MKRLISFSPHDGGTTRGGHASIMNNGSFSKEEAAPNERKKAEKLSDPEVSHFT